jgi:3-oxoacyl-[acyl-carrier protein] reductase
MDLGLSGKRALVTASSGGIGEGIARTLAAEGVRVLVHGRRADAVESVRAGIVADGGEASACAAALPGGEAVLLDALRAGIGDVEILVNNIGSYDFTTTWDALPASAWMARFEENVGVTVELVRALLPGMRRVGWGRVINIASTAALAPPRELPEYSASKAALANLTVGLARHCEGTGVTVNSISPGTVRTPGVMRHLRRVAAHRGWPDDDEVIAKRGLSEVLDDPPGGWGRPEDVGYVAAFLASPRAAWINGADVRIDGGEAGVV